MTFAKYRNLCATNHVKICNTLFHDRYLHLQYHIPLRFSIGISDIFRSRSRCQFAHTGHPGLLPGVYLGVTKCGDPVRCGAYLRHASILGNVSPELADK